MAFCNLATYSKSYASSRILVPTVQTLGALTPAELAMASGTLVMKITLWTGLALLLLGLIDYAWQRARYEHQLRRTPEDWRDDVKSVHNDVSSLRGRRSGAQSDRPMRHSQEDGFGGSSN